VGLGQAGHCGAAGCGGGVGRVRGPCGAGGKTWAGSMLLGEREVSVVCGRRPRSSVAARCVCGVSTRGRVWQKKKKKK